MHFSHVALVLLGHYRPDAVRSEQFVNAFIKNVDLLSNYHDIYPGVRKNYKS